MVTKGFGAHGESHKITYILIKKCAKFAAAQSENVHVTSLSNIKQKGSVCRTMITQFRRLLGVMETRIDVDIKIRLTCFVHSTIAKVGVMVQPMKKYAEESISHDTITNKMKT